MLSTVIRANRDDNHVTFGSRKQIRLLARYGRKINMEVQANRANSMNRVIKLINLKGKNAIFSIFVDEKLKSWYDKSRTYTDIKKSSLQPNQVIFRGLLIISYRR
jgi:uncharacterized protein Veg